MKYVVGARGSQLSVAQTKWVISELKKTNSDLDYEIKTITTKGDTDNRPLFTIDQKGIFEKEISAWKIQSVKIKLYLNEVIFLARHNRQRYLYNSF